MAVACCETSGVWIAGGIFLLHTLSVPSSGWVWNEGFRLCVVGVANISRVSVKQLQALALRTCLFWWIIVKKESHNGLTVSLSAWYYENLSSTFQYSALSPITWSYFGNEWEFVLKCQLPKAKYKCYRCKGYSHTEGWGPNWVYSARRPLNGLWYLPRVIQMMMENLVVWRLAG
jgi:hypothetical protein